MKSPCHDEICPRVLKECKDVISELLALLVWMSLGSGEVPVMWRRQASVVPILKKGDKTLTSYYRPVSLSSIVDKLMESIREKSIGEHLDKTQLDKLLSAWLYERKVVLYKFVEFLL